MKNGITIAIDGPAGAGKSTVAKRVAQALDYTLVDTGAIYRSVALLASRQDIAFDDAAAVAPLAKDLNIGFHFQDGVNRVSLDGADVTEAIRTPDMSMGASTVSKHLAVRQGLLALQRKLAGEGGAVLEGRDIGTVVCPDAEVKVYLDAAAEERARRRHQELQEKGGDVPLLQDVLDDVLRRDQQDMNRAHAPLKPAADAIVVDSTVLDIDDVVRITLEAAKKASAA